MAHNVPHAVLYYNRRWDISAFILLVDVVYPILIPHYIISNTLHWTRGVGYIGAYPTVLYFLSYILVT